MLCGLQVELGRLEIRPRHPYNDATPEVITEIELRWVRLLVYDTIDDFLGVIAGFVCDRNTKDGKYTDPNQAIVGALTKALKKSRSLETSTGKAGASFNAPSLA